MEEKNTPASSPSGKTAHIGILDTKTFNKYFLLIMFILSLAAFVSIVRIFILDMVLAAVFATLFHPLFAQLLRLFNQRRALSAFITCVLVVLLLLIPIVVIFNIVVVQAVELYKTAIPQLLEVIRQGDSGALGHLKNTSIGKVLELNNIDWQASLHDAAKYLGSLAAKFVNKATQTTLRLVVDLFIILFSIFYFLKDGGTILHRVRTVIPLSEEYKDLIVSRFSAISHATVKGILMIALIQSFLGTMTLWAFGISTWLLWGVVMLVFAAIPFLGTGAILIPTGLFKILTGDIGPGIAIILISVFVISTIDNVLRPRLVGMRAGMHDLLIFFSTLGGLFSFGPAGFIVGPLIAAIFLTILDIFSIEFQEHIKYSKK